MAFRLNRRGTHIASLLTLLWSQIVLHNKHIRPLVLLKCFLCCVREGDLNIQTRDACASTDFWVSTASHLKQASKHLSHFLLRLLSPPLQRGAPRVLSPLLLYNTDLLSPSTHTHSLPSILQSTRHRWAARRRRPPPRRRHLPQTTHRTPPGKAAKLEP